MCVFVSLLTGQGRRWSCSWSSGCAAPAKAAQSSGRLHTEKAAPKQTHPYIYKSRRLWPCRTCTQWHFLTNALQTDRVPPGSWGSSNMWRPPAESKPLADPPDSVEGFASAGEEETKRCLVSETEEEGGLRYFSVWCKVLIYRVDPKNQLRSYWNCEKGKVFILPPNISTTWMGRFSPQTEVSSLEGWWAAFKSKAMQHIINKIHQK